MYPLPLSVSSVGASTAGAPDTLKAPWSHSHQASSRALSCVWLFASATITARSLGRNLFHAGRARPSPFPSCRARQR